MHSAAANPSTFSTGINTLPQHIDWINHTEEPSWTLISLMVMDGLIIKNVEIGLDEAVKDDASDEGSKLAGKRRYIALYSGEPAEVDLNNKIDMVSKKMFEITDQKELKRPLGKLKSLVKLQKTGTVLKEKRIETLRKFAGRFLIVVNTDLPENEVAAAYKGQWTIERSFRTMKSFIEIRPIYHWNPGRIKTHVFVCVLSLVLSRTMEKLTGSSIESVRRNLNCLDAVPVIVEKMKLYVSSESDEASKILKLMKLKYPRIRESAQT